MLTRLPCSVAARDANVESRRQNLPIAGPLADRTRSAGRQDGGVRRLVDAAVLRRGRRGAPRHPLRGRHLRRQPPRQGARDRRGRRRSSSTRCFTNDLDRIGDGQAQYTLCCDEETGGVVDDLIAYRGEGDVFLVPNAAQHRAGASRCCRPPRRPASSVLDRHRDIATHRRTRPALGRRARRARPAERDGLHGLRAGRVARPAGDGLPHRLHRRARLRAAAAGRVGRRSCGTRCWRPRRPMGGLPCGLGARDTLRTEMGYPLHGHDLSIAVTPVQARLGWAVGWAKPAFWGRDVLIRRARGRRAAAAVGAAQRGPRHPAAAHAGALGRRRRPRRGHQRHVLADPADRDRRWRCCPASVSEGDEVRVDVRGKPSAMRVVKPPFVESHVR